jgi:hypothetical protein
MHKVYYYLRFINMRIENTHINKVGEIRTKFRLMLVSPSRHRLPTRETGEEDSSTEML